jgi:phage shock protein PspC (stress-responsive transcriptional regulator)
MNKTVNINLAGVFFHIDEDAFAKLHNYLDAVKKSISDPHGRDEIIRDIEARIAELFREKMQAGQEVVGMKEVEEVIAVMGQPEDYKTDDEIFEDEPSYQKQKKSNRPKKLFRDPDDCYLGGVSSGLAHYFGIDPIWIRLLWIVLVVTSASALILGYVAFWIFVPEAKTTAEKLQMRGEQVNIGNIEKKVKEGFDTVADKVKNADYAKYGRQAKSGAKDFFEGLGDVIMFCLKVIAKLIGIILLIWAGTTLIALVFGLFSIGIFGATEAFWMDYVEMANLGAPLWVLSLTSFFFIGIPFVFLFILGLKILVPNLKSIGTTAKLVLLGLWIISLFALGFFGIKQATQYAFYEETFENQNIPIAKNDTLYLKMRGSKIYGGSLRSDGDMEIKYAENGDKILYSRDIDIYVRNTVDSLAYLQITKSAQGPGSDEARTAAKNIVYTFDFQGNQLILDGYFITSTENGFRDQEVKVELFMPEGSFLYPSGETHNYHGYGNIFYENEEEHYLKILKDGAECLDCPEEEVEIKRNEINNDTLNPNVVDSIAVPISKNDSIEKQL